MNDPRDVIEQALMDTNHKPFGTSAVIKYLTAAGFTILRDDETHAPTERRALEALRKAEQAFDEIRLILVNHLDEPERSAFWKAVLAREAIRALIKEGGEDG